MAAIRVNRHSLADAGDALSVNVAHQTSVEVTLREPREILGHSVQTIRLYADQANEIAGAIRVHLDRVGSRCGDPTR